uniref:Uncharacterized protein n=1 Tax=Arundo donax TaxID=35708 RepID=A0A0A9DXW9_ARUDO
MPILNTANKIVLRKSPNMDINKSTAYPCNLSLILKIKH